MAIKARYRSGGGLDVKYRGDEGQVEFSLLDHIYSAVIRVVYDRGNDGIDFVSRKTRYNLFLGDSPPPFPPRPPYPSPFYLVSPRRNAKITRGLGSRVQLEGIPFYYGGQ